MDRTDIEHHAAAVEIRSAADGRRLEGYAAVFGERTQIGGITEAVAPGAFKHSLTSKRDVLALVDHDPHLLLGRSRTGTLRLAEDGRGLHFEIDVPKTQLGRDILALAERGDIGGASFAFTVPKDGDTWEGRNRTLQRVDLFDVSVVLGFPAYAGAVVAARFRCPRAIPMALVRRYLDAMK